eukprot:3067715-Amphidinium_carterae.1
MRQWHITQVDDQTCTLKQRSITSHVADARRSGTHQETDYSLLDLWLLPAPLEPVCGMPHVDRFAPLGQRRY